LQATSSMSRGGAAAPRAGRMPRRRGLRASRRAAPSAAVACSLLAALCRSSLAMYSLEAGLLDSSEGRRARATAGTAPSRLAPLPLVLWGAAEGPVLSDVMQGRIGNCYIMGTLAAFARHRPESIVEMFAGNDIIETKGKAVVFASAVEVRLFLGGRPVIVAVDDFVPVSRRLDEPVLAALPASRAAWPMLVEKAYAKLYGSFAHLELGSVQAAMRTLFQVPVKQYFDVDEVPSDLPVMAAGTQHTCPYLGYEASTGEVSIYRQERGKYDVVPRSKVQVFIAGLPRKGDVLSSYRIKMKPQKAKFLRFDILSAERSFWLSFDTLPSRAAKEGCGPRVVMFRAWIWRRDFGVAGFTHWNKHPSRSEYGQGTTFLDLEIEAPRGQYLVWLRVCDDEPGQEPPHMWLNVRHTQPVRVRSARHFAKIIPGWSGVGQYCKLKTKMGTTMNVSARKGVEVDEERCDAWKRRLDHLDNIAELNAGKEDEFFPPSTNKTICVNLTCVDASRPWMRIRDLARREHKHAFLHYSYPQPNIPGEVHIW